MYMDQRFLSDRFPRAAKYHPDWIAASVSGGANSLWLTEWLAEAVELRPGMRVLDLGCGHGASSIFLHREFGVEVWSVDLWCSVTERFQRIRDAGVERGVFPLHADARELPFAEGYFDVITSIDSYFYFGTDDLYLTYLARFLKPDGVLAFAGVGLMNEFGDELPEHLRAWWTPDLWCVHSAAWWRRHWERCGAVAVTTADTMPDGWKMWLQWHREIAPDNAAEIAALEADAGRNLGYVRVVACRRPEFELGPHVTSVPSEYTKAPLLRDTSLYAK
jgi:cyclopropane fatty-acyl-phospholipid synthase-like methyltransferase